MLPVKQEGLAPNGKVHQAWYPWQVCANCLAVRAKGRCSLWAYSVQVKEPLVVYELQPGGVSEYDAVYGWFTDARDAFMGKDIGYYNS